MPSFRAINQPSESPLKPTAGAPQLPNTLSRPKREVYQAHPSVVVPLLITSSGRQPTHKGDLRQAVAKAEKALEKPKKKKRSSASSTSKPRRQQAPREKKILYSIEKPTGSPSSESGNDRPDDSNFVPSEADLAEISISSCPITGSLPRDSSAPVFPEQENLTTVAALISAKPSSPSLWFSPVRQKIYDQDEFVELPRPVFEYEQGKKQLRMKRDAMMAEKRKEKGKAAEQRPVEETGRSREKRDKRKARDQTEQSKPRKRRKLEKSENARLEDLTYDGSLPSEAMQTSKQRCSSQGKSAEEQPQRYRPVPVYTEDQSDVNESPSKLGIEGRSEGSKNTKVQPSSQASAKAQHLPSHDAQLDKPREEASRKKGRKKRPHKKDCRESLKRREVSVLESFRPCSCSELPDFFTRDPSYVPRLSDWPVGKLIFFEHVKQISTCRGSIHPPRVVSACRKILEENRYPEHFPSTSGRNDSNPRRAQSSIAPPVFYGKRSGRQPDPSTGSSQPQQNGPSIGVSSKSAEFNKPCNYLTSPNSSSLGQRRRADVLSNSDERNHSFSGQENVGARQIAKILPEASSVLDRPQRSFDAQRQRFQSAPVDTRRKTNDTAPTGPGRLNNVLHEISNNAIFKRMEQRMNDFQRVILERLPATAPTQVAAAGPLLAAAANVTALAQGGNGAEQAPARRKKKPSRAEAQLRKPRLNRDVPEHLVHTDDEIIEIGRIVSAYQRHTEAPEAFAWSGRLYAKYKHLLVRSVDGVQVWTADEISRITK